MRNISSDKVKRYKELLSPSTPLGKEDGKVLREVLDQFPYTAEAAVLLSAWQKHFEPTAYSSTLKYASLFAGNRLVFNLLINERGVRKEKEKVSDTDHSGGRGELNDHSGTDPERGPKPLRQSLSKPVEGRSEGTIQEKEKEDPLALIDRFLKEEPKIKPARDYESKGEVDPDKSIVDEGGMVSETLARIHANQGNFRKAIEIYNKLSLKFPGKSSYFAARIKELQEKQEDK